MLEFPMLDTQLRCRCYCIEITSLLIQTEEKERENYQQRKCSEENLAICALMI